VAGSEQPAEWHGAGVRASKWLPRRRRAAPPADDGERERATPEMAQGGIRTAGSQEALSWVRKAEWRGSPDSLRAWNRTGLTKSWVAARVLIADTAARAPKGSTRCLPRQGRRRRRARELSSSHYNASARQVGRSGTLGRRPLGRGVSLGGLLRGRRLVSWAYAVSRRAGLAARGGWTALASSATVPRAWIGYSTTPWARHVDRSLVARCGGRAQTSRALRAEAAPKRLKKS